MRIVVKSIVHLCDLLGMVTARKFMTMPLYCGISL